MPDHLTPTQAAVREHQDQRVIFPALSRQIGDLLIVQIPLVAYRLAWQVNVRCWVGRQQPQSTRSQGPPERRGMPELREMVKGPRPFDWTGAWFFRPSLLDRPLRTDCQSTSPTLLSSALRQNVNV